MSASSRRLQVGDAAITYYNGRPFITVMIIVRDNRSHSQSGVAYRVSPALINCRLDHWIDADWFEPAHDQAEHIKSIVDGK